MKRFGEIFKTAVGNWTALFYFEIVYRTFGFGVVFLFVRYLLGILPRFLGTGHLSQENAWELLKSPPAVLFGLLILIVTAFYITAEITALMVLCECGWQREKLSLLHLCRQVFSRTAHLLRPKKIGVFLMLPVLMLSVFSPLSGYLKNIRVPEFIVEYLQGNLTLFGIFLGALAVFHMLLLLYVFGFPSMLFAGSSFGQSWRESLRLLHKRSIKTAGTIIILTGCFVFLFLALAAFFVALWGFYTKYIIAGESSRLLFELQLARWLRVIQLVGSILTSAFLCGTILTLYHERRGEERPEKAARPVLEPAPGERTAGRGMKICRVLVRMCSMLLLLYILVFYSEREPGSSVTPAAPPRIIAHRAGASFAPENTLTALTAAIDDGAAIAEIDVQQLEDGTLIVMHDTNFERTAGINLDVWDADYEMLQSLNAGAGERAVPTLEEFLQAAKGKIRLMLELKAGGRRNKMEQSVLELVERYGMEQQCMIASMDLTVLKRVKELAPAMETVYISTILITGQYDSDTVDSYGVEATFLSPEMTARAQNQGKKIYGWTANSAYTIKKVLRCGADGIITDNVPYTDYFIKEYGRNLLAEDIVSLFYSDYE